MPLLLWQLSAPLLSLSLWLRGGDALKWKEELIWTGIKNLEFPETDATVKSFMEIVHSLTHSFILKIFIHVPSSLGKIALNKAGPATDRPGSVLKRYLYFNKLPSGHPSYLQHWVIQRTLDGYD